MALNDYKITSFQKLVASLDDKPNANQGMSSAQLKAYFDSSPEELRVALNGAIDCLQSESLPQVYLNRFSHGKIIYCGSHSGGDHSIGYNGDVTKFFNRKINNIAPAYFKINMQVYALNNQGKYFSKKDVERENFNSFYVSLDPFSPDLVHATLYWENDNLNVAINSGYPITAIAIIEWIGMLSY